MAQKKKVSTGFAILEYGNDSNMPCSGCTKKVSSGSVYIGGRLVGSGSKPFLIVCPSCQETLGEWFSNRQIRHEILDT